MERLLTCQCGRVQVVSRSQAGQQLPCDCGQSVSVPTLRGMADLPLAQPATITAATSAGGGRQPSSGASANRVWQGWRGPLMALASAGCLVASAFCGWYLLQRFGIDTSYTPETEIANGQNLLDSYDANSLTTVWHEFSVMGLNSKTPPVFHLWNLYAEELEQKALTSGVIAGSFALVALAIAWSANRSRRKA